MKEIRLLGLILTAFKGFNFTFDAEGKDINIYGDNATGKTTLADAFFWLLFGKDSLGRTDFGIKTLDAEGTATTDTEHSVEGTLSFSDSKMFPTITLKRTYKEIWTKKRGQAHKTYTGNTTKYLIDGVPASKKEYTDRIAEIAGDEATFKLLTSPTVFPGLHWQKQRDLLMEVCGDISDEHILDSNKDLEDLREMLTSRTLEAHRKVIKARQAEINGAIKEKPIRIAEVSRGMPDVSGLDLVKIKSDITNIEESLADLKLKAQGIDTGGDIAGLSKELAIVQADMLKIQSDHGKALNVTMTELNTKISGFRSVLNEKKDSVRTLEENIPISESRAYAKEGQMVELREEWQRVDAQEFQDTTEEACAACGQDLPKGKVQDARKVAEALFNKNKADDLKEIASDGQRLKGEKENILKGIVAMQEKIRLLLSEVEAIEKDLNALVDELNACAGKEDDYTMMPAYADLKDKEATLEEQLATAKAGVSTDTEGIQEEINRIEVELRSERQNRDAFDDCKKGEVRISELKAEEKTLATEFEKIEAELFLTEQFIKTKVGMLTEKINSFFEITRFKLFNTLVDGGIVECCEITVDGVPFNGGLNSAARTNAGLDVCRTLMGHYGLKAPVFVDNAESVSNLVKMDSQLIRLVVSADDKKLRIEKKGE